MSRMSGMSRIVDFDDEDQRHGFLEKSEVPHLGIMQTTMMLLSAPSATSSPAPSAFSSSASLSESEVPHLRIMLTTMHEASTNAITMKNIIL